MKKEKILKILEDIDSFSTLCNCPYRKSVLKRLSFFAYDNLSNIVSFRNVLSFSSDFAINVFLFLISDSFTALIKKDFNAEIIPYCSGFLRFVNVSGEKFGILKFEERDAVLKDVEFSFVFSDTDWRPPFFSMLVSTSRFKIQDGFKYNKFTVVLKRFKQNE